MAQWCATRERRTVRHAVSNPTEAAFPPPTGKPLNRKQRRALLQNGAKTDETRALAEELKTGLSARVEAEHAKWLAELGTLLQEGRTVRALRQSSRPPKAGAPLPADISKRLADGAAAAMTADTAPERWGTVLDAVAYSPVRQQVTPQALPNKISDELRSTVKKLSKRVPEIAAMFGGPAPAPKAAPKPPPPPLVRTALRLH